MAMQFAGIVPALLTPFTPGGARVALERIAPHLRFLESRGADGVLALGTNGEFSALSMAEKRAVCDCVLEQKGRLFVLVGVNFTALPDALTFAKHAADAGADGLLVVPPFYFPNLRPPGLLQYYRAIFEAVDTPIFLYNIPSYSKIEIADEVVGALSEYPHLAGIKDTSLRLEQTEHYVHAFPTLKIFSGSDAHCGAAAAFGAVGSISACANVVPDWMRDVRERALAGAAWDEHQARLDAFQAAVVPFPPRAALKYLLKLRGGPHSDVRPPLTSLTSADESALQVRARELGLLG